MCSLYNKRPPKSIGIFSIPISLSCMSFLVDTFFKYWKLYKFALAPTVRLTPNFVYDDCGNVDY